MSPLPLRRGWCAFALVLAPLLFDGGRAAAPPPSLSNARARALAQVTPAFAAYVFDGADFPACSVPLSPELQRAYGPFRIRTAYYDASFRPVKRAERPGAYGAVVDILPRTGPTQRRFVTLYRTARPLPPDANFADNQRDDLLRAAGLGGAAPVAARQTELLKARLLGRPFSAWSRDLQAARLLAGLAHSAGERGPVGKHNDAFASDRQWWVGLKRKLYGWDRQFSRALVAPRPRKGKPAPVVRAGTLAEAGLKPGSAERIDAALQAFARDTDQAFAVCIVRRGVIVLHKAYGRRDGKPMTVDTKSWMASITKTMAAACMLMLIDRGLVDFDDSVEKFFPPLEGTRASRPLTIHHLYTHTNGLTLYGWPGWSDDMPDVAERLSAYYDRLRVGQEWAYTGTGNILGGKVLEAVTGEAVPAFYHKYLFGPLGCAHTDVTDTHAGAFSTPLDMAKFGQLLLNRGSYGDKEYFRPETFAKMPPGRLDKLLGPGAKRTFGFGLDGTAKKFGHGAASAATFHVDTERELVVIMTRNRYGKNQDKYNGKFWDALNAGIVK
jgi:CubicO group peptidase (beta-lactamase class C family)